MTSDHHKFHKSMKFSHLKPSHRILNLRPDDHRGQPNIALFAKNGLLDNEDYKSDPSMASVNHGYAPTLKINGHNKMNGKSQTGINEEKEAFKHRDHKSTNTILLKT